jgi:hypothetical protein
MTIEREAKENMGAIKEIALISLALHLQDSIQFIIKRTTPPPLLSTFHTLTF